MLHGFPGSADACDPAVLKDTLLSHGLERGQVGYGMDENKLEEGEVEEEDEEEEDGDEDE